jgi:cardiolipin synthase
VRVLLYGPGMNHAKAILVDESTAVWGSANMDLRSLFVNFEAAAVTYSEPDARNMSAWMREVFSHSRPMPAPQRQPGLFPTLGEEIGRLIGPLL